MSKWFKHIHHIISYSNKWEHWCMAWWHLYRTSIGRQDLLGGPSKTVPPAVCCSPWRWWHRNNSRLEPWRRCGLGWAADNQQALMTSESHGKFISWNFTKSEMNTAHKNWRQRSLWSLIFYPNTIEATLRGVRQRRRKALFRLSQGGHGSTHMWILSSKKSGRGRLQEIFFDHFLNMSIPEFVCMHHQMRMFWVCTGVFSAHQIVPLISGFCKYHRCDLGMLQFHSWTQAHGRPQNAPEKMHRISSSNMEQQKPEVVSIRWFLEQPGVCFWIHSYPTWWILSQSEHATNITNFNISTYINHCDRPSRTQQSQNRWATTGVSPPGEYPKRVGSSVVAVGPHPKPNSPGKWPMCCHGKSDCSFWEHDQLMIKRWSYWVERYLRGLFTSVKTLLQKRFWSKPSFSSFFCEFGRSAEKLICFVKFLGQQNSLGTVCHQISTWFLY